jgi:tubulin polyglutamylase TTLL6/13
MDNLFMHLTNYAINRNADNFIANDNEDDDDTGHKRSVSAVFKYIEENEPDVTADRLWSEIEDIAVKTLISANP